MIDSRSSREGAVIRRRRECTGCAHRFTTYEEVEQEGLFVTKRDGRREEFSRDKLLHGIQRALEKRPVSPEAIETVVDRIISEITEKYDSEVPGVVIGERVMAELRNIDEVAYIRFASVYRRFQEATDFVQAIQKMEDTP